MIKLIMQFARLEKTFMLSRHLGFQRVIFDCDMTLVTVEGIDELARLKGQAEYIAELTRQAMDGKIPLEEVARIYRRT